MRRLTAALITVAPLSCAGAAPARAASVKISSCYDGDTRRTTSGERIRLGCIDTPELRGKYAQPVVRNNCPESPTPVPRRQGRHGAAYYH